MLEEDYLSLQKHVANNTHSLTSQIIRETVLPELEKEVNYGKNFAQLRQIANAVVLATWYKMNLKQSLLGQVYANKNKVAGVDVEDKNVKMEIYNQYLQAFKKGVYNYIKEDIDPLTNQTVPRKYFSGGTEFRQYSEPGGIRTGGIITRAMLTSPLLAVRANFDPITGTIAPAKTDSAAMLSPLSNVSIIAQRVTTVQGAATGKFILEMRPSLGWLLVFWLGILNHVNIWEMMMTQSINSF